MGEGERSRMVEERLDHGPSRRTGHDSIVPDAHSSRHREFTMRNVVVTGGATGIGYAIAATFAAARDAVVITDRRGEALHVNGGAYLGR